MIISPTMIFLSLVMLRLLIAVFRAVAIVIANEKAVNESVYHRRDMETLISARAKSGRIKNYHVEFAKIDSCDSSSGIFKDGEHDGKIGLILPDSVCSSPVFLHELGHCEDLTNLSGSKHGRLLFWYARNANKYHPMAILMIMFGFGYRAEVRAWKYACISKTSLVRRWQLRDYASVVVGAYTTLAILLYAIYWGISIAS